LSYEEAKIYDFFAQDLASGVDIVDHESYYTLIDSRRKGILKRWLSHKRGIFLDYGCGTGIASSTLVKIGREVIAFDISPKVVAITKKMCNVPVVVADAHNLPFKNQVFSTICITGVLHHILDLDTVFDEIRRCAKDVICINEPSTTPSLLPIGFARRFFSVIHLNRWLNPPRSWLGSRYERPLNPDQLVQLCETRGFRVIKIRFFNHIPFLHLFLSERIRKFIFRFLISNKTGTHVEIIARSKMDKRGKI